MRHFFLVLLFVNGCYTFAVAQESAFCTLETGEAYLLQEDYASARPYYLDALALYKEQGDVYYEAYLHLMLSETSIYLGKSERGLGEAKRALYLAEQHMQPDTLSFYSLILQNLGVIYFDLGQQDQQMEYYLRALKAALKTHGRYSTQAAEAYMSVGVAKGYQNNWTASIAYMDTSLQISRAIQDPESEATTLHNLSYAYAKKGDLPRAITTQEQALDIVRSKIEYIVGLKNLGTLFIDIKDFDKAMDCFKESLKLYNELMRRRGEETVNTNTSIIYVLYETGKKAAALRELETLIDFLEHAEEPDLYDLQIAYNYQAWMRSVNGDHTGALESVAAASAVNCRGIYVEASTLYVRGLVLLEMKQYDRAHAAIQQALTVLATGNLEAPTSEVIDWRAIESIDQGRTFLAFKGQILREQALATGRTDLLEASLQSLRQADSLVTNSRLNYASQVSKELATANSQSLYGNIVETLFELYQRKGDERLLEQAFYYMEKNKALSILENLNELYARSFHDIPDKIVEQERKLREGIDSYTDLLSNPNLPAEIRDNWEGKLTELQQQQYALRAQIKVDYPRYYQNLLQLSVASLDRVRDQLLQAGETLVEYYINRDKTYALVANEDTILLERLHTPDLAKDCLALHAALVSRKSVDSLSQSLYQSLIAPLKEYIKGERLLIIPDGVLSYLPFEQLQVNSKGEPEHYLIMDYSVRHLLSASTAMQLQGLRGASTTGRIVAFAPDFDEQEALTRDGETFSRLPGAQLELDSLQAAFAGAYLRDERATEAAFRRFSGHRGVLHLATHTDIDEQFPAASRLVLKNGGEQDGYLHAYELYRIALSAELVFLSACNTGYGQIKKGEGAVSLAHAFAYSGCPNLVMTLWPVRDRLTPTLVSAYYRFLGQGMDKAEALRQAKLFYMEFEPLNNHPYYWSGFLYLGDRETLRLEPASDWSAHRNLAVAAIGLLLFLCLATYQLTRP
jgi:CHAT domain-containing protein/tetratricopeptide (TPR) repeat protein